MTLMDKFVRSVIKNVLVVENLCCFRRHAKPSIQIMPTHSNLSDHLSSTFAPIELPISLRPLYSIVSPQSDTFRNMFLVACECNTPSMSAFLHMPHVPTHSIKSNCARELYAV